MEKDRGKESDSSGIRGLSIALAVIVILAVLVFATISIALPAAHSHTDGSSGYGNSNGGYGMMSGNGGVNSIYTINNTSFNRINSVPSDVLINSTTNTVNVTSGIVTLPIEAAPTWYPRPGDFWLSYGLVNPNISIKQGTTINFIFINMDNITHMPAITTIGPPYSYMFMGSSTMDTGMMGGQSNTNGDLYAVGPMLSGTSSQNQNVGYVATNLSVTFNNPGSYWYVCLVPGHAQMGMYGEISVHD